jgi:hypothetical protein
MPYPIKLMATENGRMLVAHAQKLLDGAGDPGAGFWHTDSVSVHIRRPMLQSEMSELPEGWLACAAVDRGGREDRMTKMPPWSGHR